MGKPDASSHAWATLTPGTWLAAALTAVVLVGAMLPTLVPFLPELYFQIDPRQFAMADQIIEFGPAAAAWRSVLVLLAAAVAVGLLGRRLPGGLAAALATVGVLGVMALHLDVSSSNGWIVGGWMAAVGAAWAGWALGGQPLLLRWMLAMTLALSVPLALEAFYYVAISHPQTMAFHRTHEAQWLAAWGWEAGSPAHQAFVRRAQDSAPIGAFGLTNVLATVVAALLMPALGLAWVGWRHRGERDLMRAGLTGLTLAILLAATLWLTGSRGGIAAALLGALWLGICLFAPWRWWQRVRPRVLLLPVTLGMLVLPTVAVLLRTAMGRPETWEGERSLLFRGYYLQAGWEAFWQVPGAARRWLGLGPDGLASVLPRFKSPFLPEDVNSLHHQFMDWLVMLGPAGGVLAAGCLLLLFIALWSSLADPPVAHVTRAENDDGSAASLPAAVGPLVLGLTVTGLFLAVLLRQWTVLQGVVEARVLWLAGLIGFLAVAVLAERGLQRIHPTMSAIWLSAMWLVVLIHGQLDMAFFQPASVVLLGLVAGLLLASVDRDKTTDKPARSGSGMLAPRVLAVGLLLAAGVMAVHATGQSLRQHTLGRAWAALQAQDIDQTTDLLATQMPEATAGRWWLALMLERAETTGDPQHWQAMHQMLDGWPRDGLNDVRVLRFKAQVLTRQMQHPRWQAQEPSLRVALVDTLEQVIRQRPHAYEDHLQLAQAIAPLDPKRASTLFQEAIAISDAYDLDPARQMSPRQRERAQREAKGDKSND